MTLSPIESKLRELPEDDFVAISADSLLGPLFARWFEADQKAQDIARTLADAEQAVKDTEQKIRDATDLIKKWWPPMSAHENWMREVHPERFSN